MRQRFVLSSVLLLVLPTLAVSLLACGDDNVLNPRFQPEVDNQPDTFQFQATGVDGVTQTLSYTWSNSGVSANVDQSCSIDQGSAGLIIKDGQGTVVYSSDLADGGSFVTQEGTAGAWSIILSLDGTHGTLNFRVQKKT